MISLAKGVLLGKGLQELEKWALSEGQQQFRGRQLHEWLYRKGAKTIDSISVLPKNWRNDLNHRGIEVGRLKVIKNFVAIDGTHKLLIETDDSETFEAVGIPSENRLTVCVSSQVGCPMGCCFCATGKEGLQRSLETHEIVDQVLSIREVMERRPSHIVFMGMGEPLLNIESVLRAIRCLNSDLGIGQRKITVSTVGVINTLPKLAEMSMEILGRVQFTLAVSLHAPNQKLRESLIPTARSYPLETLLRDCYKYFSITGRRITFEYILLDSINDRLEHAEELAVLLAGFQSHINLIAYNPIGDNKFRRPSKKNIELFKSILESKRISVTLRSSRGLDQNAACGQLRRQQYLNVIN